MAGAERLRRADKGVRIPALAAVDTATASFQWSRALLRMQQLVARAGGDLQGVMDAVVNSALRIMPHADGAVVALRDGEELVHRAVSGTSSGRLGERVKLANCLSGRCIDQGQPLRCDDTSLDTGIDCGPCRATDVRSMVVVPLPHRGTFVGVLKVHSARAGAFNERDMLSLQLLVGPLATGFASVSAAAAIEERVKADRRFTATFEQAAVGIAHVSPEGRFLLLNEKFCSIAGYERSMLVGRSFQQITHPDDLQTDLGYLKSLLTGEIPNYSIEKRYIRGDGTITWVNLTVSLVHDERGDPDFLVSVIEDVNGRKRAELESVHDPLTGVLNRRGILSRLEREFGRSALSGEPMTIAFLDLDGFKRVNDELGHAQGDDCLARVAKSLSETCRPGDSVARLGGDEFLVLLPRLAHEMAPPVLQRLIEAVRAPDGGGSHGISASVGALSLPGGSALAVDDAVAAADRLMYRAKEKGRNGFVLESWRGH